MNRVYVSGSRKRSQRAAYLQREKKASEKIPKLSLFFYVSGDRSNKLDLTTDSFTPDITDETDEDKVQPPSNQQPSLELLTSSLFGSDLNETSLEIDEDALAIDMDDHTSAASDATDICDPEWTAPRNSICKKHDSINGTNTRFLNSEEADPRNKFAISPLILKRNSIDTEFELRHKPVEVPVLNQLTAEAGNLNEAVDQILHEQINKKDFIIKEEENKSSKAGQPIIKRKKGRQLEAKISPANEDYGILNKELGPMFNWLEQKIRNLPNQKQVKIEIASTGEKISSLNIQEVKEMHHEHDFVGKVEPKCEEQNEIKKQIISSLGLDLTIQEALQLNKEELLSKCRSSPLYNEKINPIYKKKNENESDQYATNSNSSEILLTKNPGDDTMIHISKFDTNNVNLFDPLNNMQEDNVEAVQLPIRLAIKQKYDTLKKLSYISEQKDQEIARIEAEKYKLQMDIIQIESSYKDLNRNVVIDSSKNPKTNYGVGTSEMESILLQQKKIYHDENTVKMKPNNIMVESSKSDKTYSTTPSPAHISNNLSPFVMTNIKSESSEVNDKGDLKIKTVLDLSSKNNNTREDLRPSSTYNISDKYNSIEDNIDQTAMDLTRMNPVESKTIEADLSAETVVGPTSTPLNLSDKEIISHYLNKHEHIFNTKIKEFCESLKSTAELSLLLRTMLMKLPMPYNEKIFKFVEEEKIHKILKCVNESIKLYFQTDASIIEAYTKIESENNNHIVGNALDNEISSIAALIDYREKNRKKNLEHLTQISETGKIKETDCYILDEAERKSLISKSEKHIDTSQLEYNKNTSNNVNKINETITKINESIETKRPFNNIKDSQLNSCQKDWIKNSNSRNMQENSLLSSNLCFQDTSINRSNKTSYPPEKLKTSFRSPGHQEEDSIKKLNTLIHYPHLENKSNELTNHQNGAKNIQENLSFQQNFLSRFNPKANQSRQNTVETQVVLEQMISIADDRHLQEKQNDVQYFAPNPTGPMQVDYRPLRINENKNGDTVKTYSQCNAQSADANYPIVRTFVRYQQIPPTQSSNQVLVSLQSMQVPTIPCITDSNNMSFMGQQQPQPTYVSAQNPSFRPMMVEPTNDILMRQQMQLKYRQQNEMLAELNRKQQVIANRSKMRRGDQPMHLQHAQMPLKNTATNESPSTSDHLCAVCGLSAHFVCSACRKISYCSRECQATSWEKQHKNFCKMQS